MPSTRRHVLDDLATAVLDGRPAGVDDALAILRAPDEELLDVVL